MEQKTICLVNSSKMWGGGEKWHYEFILELLKRGYLVYAFVCKEGVLYEKLKHTSAGIVFISTGNLSFLHPLKHLYVYRKLRSVSPSVLFLSLPNDVKVFALSAKWLGVNKIVYRRGTALPVKNNLLNKFIYKRLVTDIVANSEHIKNILLSKNKHIVNQNRLHVIKNGVYLKPSADPAGIPHNRNEKPVNIANLGRCVEQKGQEYLIRLARKLKEKGVCFTIQVLGDGELRNSFIDRVNRYALDDCIRFMGFMEDVESFLNEMDFYVSTSGHEGTSNAILEAMYAQLPVVAFNVSSMPEYVKDNETGLLANYGDIDDLEKKVMYMIRNPDERKRMGKQANEHIRTHYDFSQKIREWIELIE